MTATANAAAVKAALTITARIAGRGTAAYVAAGTALRVTRHNPDGTTATATVPLDGATDGGGIVLADVLARIVKARGPVKVTDAEDGGLRFAADGVHLGATVPNTDGSDLQQVAWPHAALTSTFAVKVEADYGHQNPEVARAAVEALQGVAEAASRGSDARAVLSAVALHADGTAAATDTYRLHVADVKVEAGPDTPHHPEALVPAHVLQAIPSAKVHGFRLGAVPDAANANGGYGMVARLHYGGKANPVQVVIDAHGPTVPGPFPRWRALVPDLQTDAAWQAPIGTYVMPEGMPEAVKAVQAKGPTAVRWSEGVDLVTLQACRMDYRNAVELAEDSATAAIGTATTGAAEVVLQGAYLAPAARFVGVGATVEVRSATKAVAMTGTGRTALVMPMRGPWS